jgi:hypothetical protein
LAVGGRVGYAVATPEGMPVTRHLVFVASVLLLSLPVAAQPDNKPVPVSKEVRAAWEKKGMVTGWVRLTGGGFMQFVNDGEAIAGDVPTFLVPGPTPGLFVGLPDADREFSVLVYPGPIDGLKLGAEDLKALAGMKRLSLIALTNTSIPSVKELGESKGLKHLYLVKNGLTDGRIAGLSKVEGLQSLSLNDNDDLTDA